MSDDNQEKLRNSINKAINSILKEPSDKYVKPLDTSTRNLNNEYNTDKSQTNSQNSVIGQIIQKIVDNNKNQKKERKVPIISQIINKIVDQNQINNKTLLSLNNDSGDLNNKINEIANNTTNKSDNIVTTNNELINSKVQLLNQSEKSQPNNDAIQNLKTKVAQLENDLDKMKNENQQKNSTNNVKIIKQQEELNDDLDKKINQNNEIVKATLIKGPDQKEEEQEEIKEIDQYDKINMFMDGKCKYDPKKHVLVGLFENYCVLYDKKDDKIIDSRVLNDDFQDDEQVNELPTNELPKTVDKTPNTVKETPNTVDKTPNTAKKTQKTVNKSTIPLQNNLKKNQNNTTTSASDIVTRSKSKPKSTNISVQTINNIDSQAKKIYEEEKKDQKKNLFEEFKKYNTFNIKLNNNKGGGDTNYGVIDVKPDGNCAIYAIMLSSMTQFDIIGSPFNIINHNIKNRNFFKDNSLSKDFNAIMLLNEFNNNEVQDINDYQKELFDVFMIESKKIRIVIGYFLHDIVRFWINIGQLKNDTKLNVDNNYNIGNDKSKLNDELNKYFSSPGGIEKWFEDGYKTPFKRLNLYPNEEKTYHNVLPYYTSVSSENRENDDYLNKDPDYFLKIFRSMLINDFNTLESLSNLILVKDMEKDKINELKEKYNFLNDDLPLLKRLELYIGISFDDNKIQTNENFINAISKPLINPVFWLSQLEIKIISYIYRINIKIYKTEKTIEEGNIIDDNNISTSFGYPYEINNNDNSLDEKFKVNEGADFEANIINYKNEHFYGLLKQNYSKKKVSFDNNSKQ